MDSFPAGVGEKLKFYVYRLIDPRNGETFYVGKGKGDRVFQHVNATRASQVTIDVNTEPEISEVAEDETSLKVGRINAIRNAGLQVIHIIHRHGIESAKAAYEVEAAVMDAYAGLTNMVAGHHSKDRGPMHALEIANKYALPEVDLQHKLIMININAYDHNTPQELLNRVRYAWRISEARAQQADYVLAVIHGIVQGVFVAHEWVPATVEHFPREEFVEANSARLGFHGVVASQEIWQHYVGNHGKRLPDDLRNRSQNPVRYYNC